jgi:hypothetical protein
MNNKDYEELSDYVDLEGTEIGEYCNSLLLMREHHPSHGMSETFDKALEDELYLQLEMFRLNTRIVETTEEVKDTRTYKELVWLDE